MRRIAKVALGGVTSCALILGGAQVASGALSTVFKEHAENLLDPAADRPFDKAKATITITEESGSTTFSITVSKIDRSLANTELGSHVHVGPCVEESGASAGPHYNHDAATGAVAPARINRETEVWFDLVPNADGVARAETTVPFVPDDSFPSNPAWVPGVMSVVIHELETDEDGSLWGEGLGYAGTRQACFPLSVPQWAE